MKSLLSSFIIPTLFLITIASPVVSGADTIPIGATPMSGSFVLTQGTTTPLPIEVPDGMIFVLTDIAIARGSGDINIFGSDDLVNPVFGFYTEISTAHVNQAFQTGLVFSGTPSIYVANGDLTRHARVSFSGYFKPAQ